jgi:hypothetical protein
MALKIDKGWSVVTRMRWMKNEELKGFEEEE